MSSGLSIALVPGYQFTVGEILTLAKLNLLATPTVNLSGTVGAAALADGSVTTPKLADGALSTNALGWGKMADAFVVTAKLADANVTVGKLDDPTKWSVQQYIAGTFAAGVYTVTLAPAPAGYTAGMHVAFKADLVNTGATSVNVNALGNKALQAQGVALVAGQIQPGQIVEAIYDGAAFQAVGLVAHFASAELALVATTQLLNAAHGLATTPSFVRAVLRCKIAENNYGIGDEVDANLTVDSGGASAFVWGATPTNVWLTAHCSGAVSMFLKTTGAQNAMTLANWKAVLYWRV